MTYAFGPALQIALQSETGNAPEWIALIPRGPRIQGRDGRQWILRDPEKIVAAFSANRADLPIDFEHSQFEKAPKGEIAPACGWIDRIEARNGEIWGRVAWNKAGENAIAAREYRYISPAFSFDRAGEIIALKGAGLVNRPNLV